MGETDGVDEITTEAELRELLGEPAPRAATKDRPCLDEIDRQWLAASPFCLVATSAADGSCDVSPKGDPPGFTVVLDDRTIALPERSGNRRADGFRNVLTNPHVGLVHLVPGRTDTLRVQGRARLVRDADLLDRMVVRGSRPLLAMVVEIESVFFHCAKAFLRSQLWDPATWHPEELPSRARIAHAQEAAATPLAELEQYYGESYRQGLYPAG
ncbi:pyridoxamine 5'-phosphate oxidase family protein [Modestobacter sp. VKM Ac-2986]|uniref:pyridoxamine 5'-phosphate oxidase family protein n=1 Tax=Modestobacter sp. VKM Ac-2986 TaxID=3004140 RepID=UPI0022AA09A5|nr:pyridoxamine 5'-phosphate oxidase family protein [Modestobacter sp. VKM Ac-2986]MCZ2827687.1 pyridoxamine 5'-phosphate oxidase family protein [Modestobacter sp. VKM Ac-2986]